MAIDYSTYTAAELGDAAARIDAERYPDNKAALDQEIARRRASGDWPAEPPDTLPEPDPERLKRRVQWSRWIVIVLFVIGAAVFFWFAGAVALEYGLRSRLVTGMVAALAAIGGAWLVAAVGLFRRWPWALWLACAMLALQIPRLELPEFRYVHHTAALYLTASFANPDDAWQARAGADFSLGPTLKFDVGQGNSGQYLLGFNIIPALLISFLLAGRRFEHAHVDAGASPESGFND